MSAHYIGAKCLGHRIASVHFEAGISFIGPTPDVLRELGNKVAARALAERVGVAVVPATEALPYDMDECP